MGQILGAPAPAECVRHPADMAVVEGTFVLDPVTSGAARRALEDAGVPLRALPVAGRQSRITIRREVRARCLNCRAQRCRPGNTSYTLLLPSQRQLEGCPTCT